MIDLNADLGEGIGDDATLLSIVTSANVATGAHAGGGDTLAATVRAAAEYGCAIGAHPSYRDRAHFGRLSLAERQSPRELAGDLAAQVLVVAAECERNGQALAHVKAHGALYSDAAADALIADAIVDGVVSVQRALGYPLVVVGLPGSQLQQACARQSIGFRREAFADRRYAGPMVLVPRDQAEAVLSHTHDVADQAWRIATGRPVTGIDDIAFVIEADTICVHGDTPGAVANARAVREALEGAGVSVAAPSARA